MDFNLEMKVRKIVFATKIYILFYKFNWSKKVTRSHNRFFYMNIKI